MPRRDGTGPSGTGEMTGRGLGYCVAVNSQVNSVRGSCRMSGGMGRRVGRGNNIINNEMLLQQKRILEQQLLNIDKQLAGNLGKE